MVALSNAVHNLAIDNSKLAALLRASREKFLASFAGITGEQSRRRAEEKTWSVLDTVEHLTVAEKTMLGLITGRRRPRSAGLPNREEVFLHVLTDRSRKLEAPEGARPKGRFANLEDAAAEFCALREATIRFVEQNTEDLRATEVTHPHPAAGTVSAYEMLIIMAKHAERHALQIEEIKQRLGLQAEAAGGQS